MDKLILWFATVFFLVYMVVAFVWPTVRTWRRTGVRPVTFGKSGNAHDYIGGAFKVLLGLVPVMIVCAWMGERVYGYLLPVGYLDAWAVQVVGMVLCVSSLVWTSVAQGQMGDSWRIGIDDENKTELVVRGLFRVSRNPIFLGMLVTLAGVFLMLPNGISLLVLVCGYLLIQIQIRLEEEFLRGAHGAVYDRYQEKTRRLI